VYTYFFKLYAPYSGTLRTYYYCNIYNSTGSYTLPVLRTVHVKYYVMNLSIVKQHFLVYYTIKNCSNTYNYI